MSDQEKTLLQLIEQAPKLPGPFQEANGAVSMRRILALVLVLGALWLFSLGGIERSIEAVYGGGGCLAGALLLLFFTTWEDIARVVSAIKGKEG